MPSRGRCARSLLGLAVTGVVLAFVAAPVASATTFTVTKTADTDDGACDSDCSLREAVIATNSSTTDDVIELPAGTYRLTLDGPGEDAAATGDIDLLDSGLSFDRVRIAGAGARTTTIEADGTDRVFDLHAYADVTMSGLTVTGGGGVAQGGGIRADLHSYVLSLQDAAVVGNSTSATGNVADRGADRMTPPSRRWTSTGCWSRATR